MGNIDKLIRKNSENIFGVLVSRNRYSKYLVFSGWGKTESAILQSIVVADLGDTIMDFTGLESDKVKIGFELFFESKFDRDNERFLWNGLEINDISKRLMDHISSHEMGKILSVMAIRSKLISRKMINNKFYYLCNGYRELLG
jgi:hypothetical protein